MFQRRHFEAVAGVFRRLRESEDYQSSDEYMVAVHKVATELAETFAATNSNFSRERFFIACGFRGEDS